MTAAAAALVATVFLAVSIAYTGQFRFLGRHPRSQALSAASGVTIGYVFLGLLPKLQQGHEKLKGKAEGIVPLLEHHVFFIAMLGMIVFYGLVLATHVSRRRGASDTASVKVFGATVSLYALYVFLLGELLADTAKHDIAAMLVLAIALTFHFAGSDFGMRENHKDRYIKRGRWILAAATIAGWAVGAAVEVPASAIALTSAFLVGAILINVLNDELPDAEAAHFLPFAVGAVASGLLLASIG